MTTQRKQDDHERREIRSRLGDADTEGASGRPARAGGRGDVKHDRLDTIEWADDRTQALDPRGGLDDDPMDALLDGRESDATYREEAERVTPTLGPASESELDR